MKQRLAIFLGVLIPVLVTAWVLHSLKSTQRQAPPGVRLVASAEGGQEVFLPEQVEGFTSRQLVLPPVLKEYLPRDTTYGARYYENADGFLAQTIVVLMGKDRTSIHRPQICLPLQGARIASTETVNVPAGPGTVPVVKLVLHNAPGIPGSQGGSGLFVYWFVSDRELVADAGGFHRAWTSARRLLATGELERWAYVSLYTTCPAGEEERTFERLKALIGGVAPQLLARTPGEMVPPQATASATAVATEPRLK